MFTANLRSLVQERSGETPLGTRYRFLVFFSGTFYSAFLQGGRPSCVWFQPCICSCPREGEGGGGGGGCIHGMHGRSSRMGGEGGL